MTLHLGARVRQVGRDLRRAVDEPGEDIAPAALAIARIEYPSLDAARYLAQLDRMGEQAASRIKAAAGAPREAVRALGEYLYDEQGFRGNREAYDDPRNSFLNEVLERRTGIPISLATVYLEVARRAGLRAAGINFPGHFLVRVTAPAPPIAGAFQEFMVVDPFDGGALLSHDDCRQLLRQHVGSDEGVGPDWLGPASRLQIVARMLVNLKRLYVRMQSLPQAHFVSTLLLELQPTTLTERRDRGLIAYHLEDFAGALQDLETYLDQLPAPVLVGARAEANPDPAPESTPDDDSTLSEAAQIREQVQGLRRRIAGFN